MALTAVRLQLGTRPIRKKVPSLTSFKWYRQINRPWTPTKVSNHPQAAKITTSAPTCLPRSTTWPKVKSQPQACREVDLARARRVARASARSKRWPPKTQLRSKQTVKLTCCAQVRPKMDLKRKKEVPTSPCLTLDLVEGRPGPPTVVSLLPSEILL